MALPPLASFAALLALTLATSTVYTPASILADAAVMAASSHVRDTRGSLSNQLAWLQASHAAPLCLANHRLSLLPSLPAAGGLWAAAHMGVRQLDSGEPEEVLGGLMTSTQAGQQFWGTDPRMPRCLAVAAGS